LSFSEDEKAKIYAEIDDLIENTSLFVPNKKTCIIDQRNYKTNSEKYKKHILNLSSNLESISQNNFWAALKSIGMKEVYLYIYIKTVSVKQFILI
jgi:hypothetical protein